MKSRLRCRLFGHMFIGRQAEFFPHYDQLVKNNLATTACDRYDYRWVWVPQDYCQWCGLTKKELGIIPNQQ